jgi:hypothetical protein
VEQQEIRTRNMASKSANHRKKVNTQSSLNLLSRGRLGANTIRPELNTPVGLLLLCLPLGFKLLELLLHAFDIALFRDQSLEPLVLHFELVDPVLKRGDLVGHLLGLLLQGGLTLLLLDTETCRGGGVATTLVLFGGEARCLFQVGYGCNVGCRCFALVARLAEVVRLRRVRALEAAGRAGRNVGG